MSSQLRVDNILPSAGTALGIGTASGSITFNSSNISGDVIFNDDVTVNGLLTYEDVTNIDSVGVVTARSGLQVTGGNVGIDQSNPTNKLEVEGSASVARFVGNRTDALGPRLSLAKSRGSTSGSATIVQDGDEIGQIMFKGADGTDADSTGAAIIARVNGTPGVNDMPGALTFLTTNDGTNSPTERLRITKDGDFYMHGNAPTHTTSSGSIFLSPPSGNPNRGILWSNTSDTHYVKLEPSVIDGLTINGYSGVAFATGSRSNSTWTERFRISSSGAVGFNTTLVGSPQTVHIAGDYKTSTQNVADEGLIFQSFTTASTGNVYPGISWSGNPNALGRARASITAIATNDNNGSDLVFLTRNQADGTELDVSDDEKVRITSDGKFGIGTDNPAGTLSIYKDSNPYLYFQNSASGTTGSDGFSMVYSGSDMYIANRENGILSYETPGGTERLRIDSAGTIKCGTSSVLKAEINSAISGHQFISQCDDNNNGFEIYQQHGSTTTRNTFAVYANTGGGGAQELQFSIRGDGCVTKPKSPAFSANLAGGNLNMATHNSVIVFNNQHFDTGNNYNTSNGRFTAPVAGRYYFGVQIYAGFGSGHVRVLHAQFQKNGADVAAADMFGGASDHGGTSYHPTGCGHMMIDLAANDWVAFNSGSFSGTGSGHRTIYAASGTRFFGYLVG